MSQWEDLSDAMKGLTVVIVLAFIGGAVLLGWMEFFGPRFADQRYKQFQHSTTHRGAVADDLAARCVELAQASDPATRRAIEGVIYARTSGIDVNSLDLAPDVRTCVDHAREDYINGR